MVNSFAYSLIPSDEFLTFGTRVVALFDGKVTVGSPIEIFVKAAKQNLTAFSDSFMHNDRNPYTEKLVIADAFRDDEYYAFRYYIQACSFCSLEGWSEAGKKIIAVFRKHGWRAAHMGYKAETAALINISAEIHEKFQTELTFIKGEEWLTRMETAQQRFEALMLNNVEAISDDTPTVTSTRPKLTSALRALLGYLSFQNEVASTPELTDYITKINDLIVLTLSTVKANETRQENEKNSAPKTETK